MGIFFSKENKQKIEYYISNWFHFSVVRFWIFGLHMTCNSSTVYLEIWWPQYYTITLHIQLKPLTARGDFDLPVV